MIGRTAHLLRIQPPVVDNRGLLWGSGATVPADNTDGWQTGAIWQKTDGGSGTALYVNEGSVTACDFNAIDAGGITTSIDVGVFASITAGDGIALSSTDTSAVAIYGDDAGLSIASNVYNLRTRLLLTVDQDGASIRALMAQLKLIDGVDVSTGIYTALQGYVELAGDTSAETGSTFSCIDASLEIGAGNTLTVDAGGEACGIHVETTGTGTISATGTCAGILVDKASGAADWTNGVIVKNSTRGVVLTGITAQAIDIQTSGVVRMGVEGTGIPVNNTYPYGMEIHTKTTTDFAQPATGVSAGIYSRYEHSFDQVTATGHAAVFAKFRVKKDLKDGVHAAAYNYVEVSGGANTDIGGTATTTTTAGIFAIETDSGFILSAGHLNGIVVDSSIHATGTFTGTISGIRIKKSGSAKAWPTGIAIEASAITTGISIGTCTTGIITSGVTMTDEIKLNTTASTRAIFITGGCMDGIKLEGSTTTRRFMLLKADLGTRHASASDDSFWGIYLHQTHGIDAAAAHFMGFVSYLMNDVGDAFQEVNFEADLQCSSGVNRLAGIALHSVVTAAPSASGAAWGDTGLRNVGMIIYQGPTTDQEGEAAIAIDDDWNAGIWMDPSELTHIFKFQAAGGSMEVHAADPAGASTTHALRIDIGGVDHWIPVYNAKWTD